MSNENRKWDSLFLGILDENSNKDMRINIANDSIKFPILIKSTTPGDFPMNIKEVNGFSDSLQNALFRDRNDISNIERYEDLKIFLRDYLLIFKVREEKHKEFEKYYYNAYDIELVKKESNDTSTTYCPIPIITTSLDDLKQPLQKLSNNEFIKHPHGVSYHEDDTPSFVILQKREIWTSSPPQNFTNNSKYYAVGPVENMIFSEEYGYKYNSLENKRYIEVETSYLADIYFDLASVVAFVPLNTEQSITRDIEDNGKNIQSSVERVKLEDQDENKFLKTFKDVALSRGLSYDMNDLINFHTAMKTQSFVILAGMSGTGKSQIVQCYHEALNKYAKGDELSSQKNESKLLFVPVRPFWQDDSDLLGYLDTLNGIYRPGESGLVDFIYESQQNRDECYIVCLDEMNLARVEYYFSQFLSILEREPAKRIISLYNEKLIGRVYNQNDYPSKLVLGENIFFVGTVNIDESTFQFSDKVLDRANVISLKLRPFNSLRNELRLKKEKTNQKSLPSEENLTLNDLRTFIKFKGMKKQNQENLLSSEELDLLWNIHSEINKVNPKLGVGYRIVNQIETYIMNIPTNNSLTREKALDLQVNQRVFTKLRGSDIQLKNLVGSMEDDEYKPGILYTILEKNNVLSEFEDSKKRLQTLAQELTEYGYAI